MIHLLYGTNASYCEQTAVSMRSVFENNRQLSFHVHLLCEAVPAALQEQLCRVGDEFPNVAIECVDPEPFVRPLLQEFHLRTWRGSTVQYIYASICSVFPKLDRILWLDGDVICRGSLRELWETEMGEACVAAGLDCTPFLAVAIDRVFYRTPFYFNAGVLLFDLENCRRHELQQRCRSVLRGYGETLQYCDQSMLNLALPPHLVHRLDLRWNYPAGIGPGGMRCVAARSTPQKETFTVRQWKETLADLRLLHYIGGPLPTKPWYRECRSPFRLDYLRYRAHTSWGKMPLQRWQMHDWKETMVTGFSKTWDTPAMAHIAHAWQALHGFQLENRFPKKF